MGNCISGTRAYFRSDDEQVLPLRPNTQGPANPTSLPNPQSSGTTRGNPGDDEDGIKAPPTFELNEATEFLASVSGHAASTPQDGAGETTPAQEPKKLDQDRINGLEAHGQQMVSNQASLNKWNLNGEGRNQGVVHLIDYAKARPSKLAVDGKTLQPAPTKKSGRGNPPGLSEEKIGKLLEADKKGYRAPTHNELTDSTDKGRFQLSDADVKTLQDKNFLTPLETPAYNDAKQQLNDATKDLKTLDDAKTSQLQGAGITGRALGENLKEYKANDPARKAAQEAVERADAHLKASTHYVMTSDKSKGGRLEQIAQAGGRDKIANGKEIEDGTAIVEGLTRKEGVDKLSQVKPPDLERPLSGYRKTEGGSWKEESIPADERKHTASTSVTGNGLNIKGWGVMENPEGNPFDDPNVKFSTVMGASKT